MKTLILMRHAKSSMDEKEKHDWDRPLSKRGKKNAVTMAKVLEEKGIVPQVILSSAAVRAHQTTDILAEEIHFKGDIHYLAGLYQGEVESYLTALHQVIPDSADVAMVVGHNPVLESFLQMMTGKVESLPTASLAYLHLQISSWSELSFEVTGELVELRKPKDA